MLALGQAEPTRLKPLQGAPSYLAAELRYGASHEGALHLDDLLTRRTRISAETPDRGVAAAPEVARIVAPVLGWDKQTAAREVQSYLARVASELDSHTQPDDSPADEARLGAPYLRLGAAVSANGVHRGRLQALKWAFPISGRRRAPAGQLDASD